jgi:Putative zinc-finger
MDMDITCTLHERRGEILIGYLYDDIDPAERAAFDRHLAVCAECRYELGELGLVRERLEQWTPPEPVFVTDSRLAMEAVGSPGRVLAGPRPRSVKRLELPVWAQVAAAMLVVGLSAGLANLRITYDDTGLSVTTGWMPVTPAPVPAATAPPVEPTPWKADLAALEQELRGEMGRVVSQPVTVRSDDAETMRRVRALIDDSEKRQQRELSLRVAEMSSDMRAQRTNDLRTIGRNLTEIQTTTGAELMRLYRVQNDLAVKVGQVR